MKIETAVDTLHRASGIALTEIQAIAKDLESNGVITMFDDELSSHDAASLYLRLIVPHIELDTFIAGVSDAGLFGAKIYDDAGGGFDLVGDELGRNTYTELLWCQNLAEAIGSHLEAIASSEANRADYQTVLTLTVHQTAHTLTAALVQRFDGFGFKQSGTCILVYGDGEAYFGGAQGRHYSVSIDALDALGEALRQSRQLAVPITAEPVTDTPTPKTLH